MNKPKLTIFGDSFMAFDPIAVEYNTIHWATQLTPYVEIVNLARPGYSNAQILLTIFEYFNAGNSTDYAVLGLTNYYRVEFDRHLSSCHPEVYKINPKFKTYKNNYIKYTPGDIEIVKNFSIVKTAIDFLKTRCEFVYSLNGLNDIFEFDNLNSPEVSKIIKKQLKLKLVDFIDPAMPIHPSFHVTDAGVHKQYADEIINTFNLTKIN